MPGVWGGVLLVFVIALGFYVTPAILGGPTDVMIAQLIDEQANDFGNFAEATMLGLLLLLLTVAILVLLRSPVRARQAVGGGRERRGIGYACASSPADRTGPRGADGRVHPCFRVPRVPRSRSSFRFR